MLSAKILFFLITSTFLQHTSQEKQIRGTPEVDYPTYYVIPNTSFRCSDQLYNPGFYADTETRCQVFHYCYEHRQESFLCPMGTIFNQPILACDYWYSSNCSLASSYYHVNADKRKQDQYDEADDSLNLPSENLFDKMAHLYEINNEASNSPDSEKNASDTPENDFLGRDGVETPAELFIDENNKTEDYNKYNYNNRFNMIDEEQPEVVKYQVSGVNTLNIHEVPGNEQIYETDEMENFIFSDDGMLHQSQEDTYQMYPMDMNFNQEYSGYAEIPSDGSFNYDLNDEFDPEGNFQTPDLVLQKRHADYVRRRPSNRKPILVIPEVEPEIVQLPVVKYKRKPIGIDSTVSTNDDTESSYATDNDFNIYKEDTVSTVNEVIESTTPVELSLDGTNSDLNDYDERDQKLFYEVQEEIADENGLQQHQKDSLNVIYDFSNQKKTRNAYVVPNNDEAEISPEVFGSGNDFLSVSYIENRNTLVDSNYRDELKRFMGHNEDFGVLPEKSLETASEDESFDRDSFLGSGSEDNINLAHLSDGSSFPEGEDIFSDTEDTDFTGTEAPSLLPMNFLDTFEGSGISVHETADASNFNEEAKEPNQFVLKDPENSMMHGKEISFSSENSENFSPLDNSEDIEQLEFLPEGSGGSNEFNYLPHELQESSVYPKDASDVSIPEIREIDGSYYYVFSDSEYADSSGFISKNEDYAATGNADGIFDRKTEEYMGHEEPPYFPEDPKLKTEASDGSLDYQDATILENAYDKLSGGLEMESSSDIPEEYVVDESDNRELSSEDLKYLEIMSQNPSTMMKNLFEVTNEKSSSHAIKGEMPNVEIVSPEQNINEEAEIHEDPDNMESLDSDISSNIEEHSPKSSEILNVEQIAEEFSNTSGSGEDGSQISPLEPKLETVVPGKEGDPLFVESDKIMLDVPGKHKLPQKIPPVQSNILAKPVIGKELKKVSRGKRFNENLQTFNPPNKGRSMMVPSRDTFRETMFTNIPSTFLKMKHSTLRPYFHNYDLKNPGFNPRTGDLLQSSKLSKLTSLGKRLLAAKSAKFNRMKKFADSYRN